MKIFIFTCLLAVALGRPKFPLRHPELPQNEAHNSQEVLKERKFFKFALPVQRELRKEYLNELNKRELLREKQKAELKEYVMNDSEQKTSISSSSSEEVISTRTEKDIPREDVLNQRYLEQLNKYNLLQLEAVQNQKYIPTQKWSYSYLEQLPRTNEYNHIQLRQPVVNQEQVYFYLKPVQQLDAAWYYPPQIMQYIPYSPFYGIMQPIAPESIEKTDAMSE